MKLRWIAVVGVLFVWFWPGSAMAVTITDSISAFSNTQGQDGWFYGFSNQTVGGGFQLFDTFNVVDGRWEASDAQVGANNNDFLNVNSLGGHPTGLGPIPQDAIIWAVRRYMSPVSGFVDIAFDLRKANIVNPLGGGITGRIFVDGTEVLTQFVANIDGAGVQQTITTVRRHRIDDRLCNRSNWCSANQWVRWCIFCSCGWGYFLEYNLNKHWASKCDP